MKLSSIERLWKCEAANNQALTVTIDSVDSLQPAYSEFFFCQVSIMLQQTDVDVWMCFLQIT